MLLEETRQGCRRDITTARGTCPVEIDRIKVFLKQAGTTVSERTSEIVSPGRRVDTELGSGVPHSRGPK